MRLHGGRWLVVGVRKQVYFVIFDHQVQCNDVAALKHRYSSMNGRNWLSERRMICSIVSKRLLTVRIAKWSWSDGSSESTSFALTSRVALAWGLRHSGPDNGRAMLCQVQARNEQDMNRDYTADMALLIVDLLYLQDQSDIKRPKLCNTRFGIDIFPQIFPQ